MNTRKLIFTVLLLATSSVLAAQTEKVPTFADMWGIQHALETLKPKDQFETTAQYEARFAAVRPASSLVVRVDDSKVYRQYNADTTDLTIWLETANSPTMYKTIPDSGALISSYSNSQGVPFPERIIELDSKSRDLGKHLASNAYGATVNVEDSTTTIVALSLYGDGWRIIEPQLTAGSNVAGYIRQSQEAKLLRLFSDKLDPTTARNTVPHLHVAIECDPRSSLPLLEGVWAKGATIDSPTSMLVETYLIPVQIRRVILFDDRSSAVVANKTFELNR